jgi:hypothetical protein
MYEMLRAKGFGRFVHGTTLVVGILALAGCATGYSLVQPDVTGSGSYYTSDVPYSGQGYFDYYGTGPYYPGTSGWGYYNGTSPYSNSFGWYGADYGGYGYWPFFNFNVGISSVWDFPGYWGPWYSTGLPVWECPHRGCGHHYHGGHHHHGEHDSVAGTAPRPWLKPDHTPLPLHVARETAVPVAMIPNRPEEGTPEHRRLESASFAPPDFAQGADRRPNAIHRPVETSAMPVRVSEEPHAFAIRSAPVTRTEMASPREFTAPPHAAFRPAPISQPAPHRDETPATKIH